MSKTSVLISALALSALAAAACSDPSPPAQTKATTKMAAGAPPAKAGNEASAAAEAKEMFKGRCSPCHGENGKGDGPGAAALNPKPRDYTDAVWQKSVTDDQLRKTIVMGGAAVGKSPIMPGSPDLESKPEVVDSLVKLIRSYNPK